MIAISILEGTYNNITQSAGGDEATTVGKIIDSLNQQRQSVNDKNAADQTAYLTDYSKLTQIGTIDSSGQFNWANASIDQISSAKQAAAKGMTINFYRSLLPTKLRVIWSYGNQPPTDTPDKYDCIAGQSTQGSQFPPTESYVATGYPPFAPPFNWNIADNLTGVAANGQLDAIWYMMLLGANLGWDLGYPNPYYTYDALKNGFPLPSSGCGGNGSTTGIVTTDNTSGVRTRGSEVAARLAVVPHNVARLDTYQASQALRALERLDRIAAEGTIANAVLDNRLKLMIQETTRLIRRIDDPMHASPEVRGGTLRFGHHANAHHGLVCSACSAESGAVGSRQSEQVGVSGLQCHLDLGGTQSVRENGSGGCYDSPERVGSKLRQAISHSMI